MTYVLASQSITNALQKAGYKNVPLRECDVLDQQFELGKNISFYIDKDKSLQEVNVWLTKDRSSNEVAFFSISGRLGKNAPITLDVAQTRSLCSLFEAIVGPEMGSFRDYLTLWTKGGGLFGKPMVAALVYHCPVARSRTVSGTYTTGGKINTDDYGNPTGLEEESMAQTPSKESGSSKVLGGVVVLVTIAGLAYWLWKKNRDKKRAQEEQEQEQKRKQTQEKNIQLFNAIADSLPDVPKSATKGKK